jgi:beta-lactamase regulating signal transducer with metallopeptidase domain
VLLPFGFADGLSEQETRAIALHEAAHIRRRDLCC